mgnify:CR=1 FL=1
MALLGQTTNQFQRGEDRMINIPIDLSQPLNAGDLCAIASSQAAVNQVQTAVFTDSTGSGTFTLSVPVPVIPVTPGASPSPLAGTTVTTAAITYSATLATLKSRIQTALDNALGTNQIVVAGSAITAITLTQSGSLFQAWECDLITHTDTLTSVTLAITITTAGQDANTANTIIPAGSWPWTTDYATTVAAFVAAFVGVSKQAKSANLPFKFNGTARQLVAEIARSGEYRALTPTAGTYSINSYVGPTQNGTILALSSQNLQLASGITTAVGRVIGLPGDVYTAVNPAWVDYQLLSTVDPEGYNR